MQEEDEPRSPFPLFILTTSLDKSVTKHYITQAKNQIQSDETTKKAGEPCLSKENESATLTQWAQEKRNKGRRKGCVARGYLKGKRNGKAKNMAGKNDDEKAGVRGVLEREERKQKGYAER